MKKNFFNLIVLSILGLYDVTPNASAQESPATPITTEELLGIAPGAAEPASIEQPSSVSEPVAPEPVAAEAAVPEQTANDTATQPVSLLEKSITNNNEKKDAAERSIWKHGSIMFPQKSIVEINSAIRSVTEGIPLEILLPNYFAVEKAVEPGAPKAEITPEQVADGAENMEVTKKAVPATTYTYYLKSILYFAPDNWTLWLNDKKISSEEFISDINIANVTSDFVVLLWKQANPDVLFPSWKESFMSLGNDTWASVNKNIVINSTTGDISFIIKPNQSFVSDIMEIVEGPVGEDAVSEKSAGEEGGTMKTTSSTTSVAKPTPTPKAGMENELNSPHMRKYLDQIHMLQSVLEGGAAPAEDVPPVTAPN